MAQIRTTKKTTKLTYDCAALSDIHFAILEKYSILIPVPLIIHAHAQLRPAHHGDTSKDDTDGHLHNKHSPPFAQLKQHPKKPVLFSLTYLPFVK